MVNEMGDDKESTKSEGDEKNFVTLGRVSGAHGIKGWVKVFSETSPRENIAKYSPLYLNRGQGWVEWEPETGRIQGKSFVMKFKGCNDRNLAEALKGCEIAVPREQFADNTQEGEYYWTDLEGLFVSTKEGIELGQIDYLFETGSNDVIVVAGDKERLVPYIWEQVVLEVDLEQRRMVVDWDPDF